jgi:SAM-dependent methyltransferase
MPDAVPASGDEFVVAHLPDVRVDGPTRAAAVALARVEGLDVVDLVPGDLPAYQAVDLARAVDTRSYRTAPLAPGRGALHALVVRRSVWDRAATSANDVAAFATAAVNHEPVSPAPASHHPAPTAAVNPHSLATAPANHDPAPTATPANHDDHDEASSGCADPLPPPAPANQEAAPPVAVGDDVVVPDRASMVHLTEQLKLYAPRATDVVVAPDLRAAEASPGERLEQLRALYGTAAPIAVGFPALRTLMVMAGVLATPGWAAVAAAETFLQPFLVAGGISPRVPPRRGTPVGPWALLRAAREAPAAPAGEDPVESRRAGYAAELARGTQRFFEPRRITCPWCDSPALVHRLRTPDLTQFKPGEFFIDQCNACGLVFQNPRLTIEGLDFYYRDFYDGLGAGEADFLFSQSEPSYWGRVALAQRHAAPRTWLDVGTGYGHFCVVAAGLLPSTRFDGLDMGRSVEDARLRGWIAEAYRGLFPDLAPELKGQYDVVSMHHYLEHTRDPRAELDAAYTALAPGGHLLIEVPDPESRFALLLGRYWVPWLQPQHQQFLSVTHLRAAVEAIGFTVVEVERGPVRQPVDVAGALWLLFCDIAPWPRVPWRDPPTMGERVTRWGILAAMAPLLVGGLVVDRALQPLIATRAQGWSNAYRVLAQR